MAGNANGIDVSNFAGQFDWAATSGLSFGICRASQGLGAPGTNSPDPSFQPNVEVEVQSGQLNTGTNAVTVITVPHGGGTNIAFGCDNGLQGMPPAVLRVAIYDTRWHITNNVTVDSTKGQTVLPFPDPKSTRVISVKRLDADDVIVGYEVS